MREKSYIVVQVGLELTVYPRLASNLEISAYPDLINVVIPGLSQYIWLSKLFSPSQFDSFQTF